MRQKEVQFRTLVECPIKIRFPGLAQASHCRTLIVLRGKAAPPTPIPPSWRPPPTRQLLGVGMGEKGSTPKNRLFQAVFWREMEEGGVGKRG